MIAGGAAPEIELAVRLAEYAQSLSGVDQYCIRAFAEALEVIPYTLAENAGLNPIATVTELRNRHAQNDTNAGINVRKVEPASTCLRTRLYAVYARLGSYLEHLGRERRSTVAGFRQCHPFSYGNRSIDPEDRRHRKSLVHDTPFDIKHVVVVCALDRNDVIASNKTEKKTLILNTIVCMCGLFCRKCPLLLLVCYCCYHCHYFLLTPVLTRNRHQVNTNDHDMNKTSFFFYINKNFCTAHSALLRLGDDLTSFLSVETIQGLRLRVIPVRVIRIISPLARMFDWLGRHAQTNPAQDFDWLIFVAKH